eukprot:COSAG01_NODE_5063_length_4518_cov_2.220923_5_plen_298_part_01
MLNPFPHARTALLPQNTRAISSHATLLRLRTDHNASRVVLDMRFAVEAAHSERGAPAALQAEVRCHPAAPAEQARAGGRRRGGGGHLDYRLRWFGKPPPHSPETLWLSHIPIQLADLEPPPPPPSPPPPTAAAAPATWRGGGGGGEQQPMLDGAGRRAGAREAAARRRRRRRRGLGRVEMDKLGLAVDPMAVDLSGAPGCDDPEQKLTCGLHLHGVGPGGVTVRAAAPAVAGTAGGGAAATPSPSAAAAAVRLVSLDSALVSIGSPEPVPTPLVAPDVSGGVHFALVGNVWNTNYPFW